MPLIYSFVARGTTVLADYTAYTGNFSTVAIQCLEKVPSNNSRFTFTCDRHTFNYSVDGGYSEYFRPCVCSRYCCTCFQTEAGIVSDQYHSQDETVIRHAPLWPPQNMWHMWLSAQRYIRLPDVHLL